MELAAATDGQEQLIAAVQSARDFPELQVALRKFPEGALRSRQLAVVDRTIQRLSQNSSGTSRCFRLALLGNHTLDPLELHCRVRHAMCGVELRSWVAPYGQYAQVLLDPASRLHDFAPDAIFLSLNIAALCEELVAGFADLSSEAIESARNRIFHELDSWVATALARTKATLLVCNFPRPPLASLGVSDSQSQVSEAATYLSINLTMLERYRNHRRVFVFDMDRLVAGFGAERAFSSRQYFLAKIPWTDLFVARIASELVRYSFALSGRGRKCLIVDLDNTIWGGIIGEDGPSGLKIGPGSAAGEAFQRFQLAIRSLKSRGVLLAICSKNNPSDVDSVFAEDGRMPLRRSDFVAERVNWQPKPDNIVSIANQLNIGLDSLVFADDNPLEREFVRMALPDVAVLELPADPANFVDALLDVPYFEQASITQEDRAKTQMYEEESRRVGSMRTSASLDDYLSTLESRLYVRRASSSDRDRIHQLFGKTNQFNLTTRRYTLAQVDDLLSDDAFDLFIARLSDKFGDLGTIALALISREGDEMELDSFVMSCRAMGRGAETALMNVVKSRCKDSAARIRASYLATRRNVPASSFLPSQGFVEVARDGEKITYLLERPHQSLITCSHISVREEHLD